MNSKTKDYTFNHNDETYCFINKMIETEKEKFLIFDNKTKTSQSLWGLARVSFNIVVLYYVGDLNVGEVELIENLKEGEEIDIPICDGVGEFTTLITSSVGYYLENKNVVVKSSILRGGHTPLSYFILDSESFYKRIYLEKV